MSLIALGLMAGGASGIESYLTGRSMAQSAMRKLEEFEPQQLVNPFEKLTPSLQLERQQLGEISQSRAGALDVAQGMDAATALGLSSNVIEQTGEQQAKLFGTMAQKKSEFDVMEAQDDARIRQMQERREEAIIASLSDELAAGRQMKSDALMGFAKMSLAGGLAREQRLAGLGYDPMQDRIAEATRRIEAGEGSVSDYLLLQQGSGLFRR